MPINDIINLLVSEYNHLGSVRHERGDQFFENWERFCTTIPQSESHWNLSAEEYDSLKQLLGDYSGFLYQAANNNMVCRKLIQLYIFEWNMRERDGYSRGWNALSAIGAEITRQQANELFGIADEQQIRNPQPQQLNAQQHVENNNAVTRETSALVQFYLGLFERKEWRRTCDYAWQMKLTLLEYQALKQILSGCHCLNNTIGRNPLCSKCIALYVGEWYKREYNGRGTNAFDSINYNAPHIQQIVQTAGIPLYRKNNNVALFSLYVYGGLPIHFLVQRYRNVANEMLRQLASFFDDDDNLDELENLCQNNTAINQSYSSQGSIFSQIACLKEKQFPFDDSDMESDEYQDFRDFVLDGLRESEKNKFGLRYKVVKYSGKFIFGTEILFTPESNGERNHALSEKRLISAGVPTENLYRFAVDFMKEDVGQSSSVLFFKCLNGDWVPNKQIKTLELPDMPFTKLSARVRLSNGSTYDLPALRFTNRHQKGILQFFSEDGIHWTTYGNGATYSAVLFDKYQWEYRGEDCIEPVDNTDWNWLEINKSQVELHKIVDDSSYVIKNVPGKLVLDVLHPLFNDPTCFYPRQNKTVWCQITRQAASDEENGLQTVYSQKIEAFAVPPIRESFRLTTVDGADLHEWDPESIFIKDDLDSEYQRVTWDDIAGRTGFCHVKFVVQRKSVETDCFFVSDQVTVRRILNGHEGTIFFHHFDGLTVSSNDGNVSVNNDEGRIRCNYDSTFNRNTCRLNVSDERGNILFVNVIFPYQLSDVVSGPFGQGKYKVYDTDVVPVPFLDKYMHRSFTREGCKMIPCSSELRWDINNYVHLSFLNRERETNGAIRRKYKIYTNSLRYDRDFNGYVLCRGNNIEDQSQYHFYFCPSRYSPENGPYMLPIETIQTNAVHPEHVMLLTVPNELQGVDGMIVQSFADVLPLHCFKSENITSLNLRPPIEFIDYQEAISHFNFCCQEQTPFLRDSVLCRLYYNDDRRQRRLATFFVRYVFSCGENNPDYLNLKKMANQFLCDWKEIPNRSWAEALRDTPVQIHRIVNPFLQQCDYHPDCIINLNMEKVLCDFVFCAKHKCLFGWFDSIKKLCVYNDSLPSRLSIFYVSYINYCYFYHITIDYNSLWRLASEFMFDWLLIPSSFWRERVPEKWVDELIQSRPGMSGSALYCSRLLLDRIYNEQVPRIRDNGAHPQVCQALFSIWPRNGKFSIFMNNERGLSCADWRQKKVDLFIAMEDTTSFFNEIRTFLHL